jgi:hypothetical protein
VLLRPRCNCSNARATYVPSTTCRRPAGCGRSIPKLEAKSVIPLFCSIMFKAPRMRRLKGRMLLHLYLRQKNEADFERKQLAQLQKKDSSGNDRCCDCGAPSPQWVCHAVLILQCLLTNNAPGITKIRHFHMSDMCWYTSLSRCSCLLRSVDIYGRLQAE